MKTKRLLVITLVFWIFLISVTTYAGVNMEQENTVKEKSVDYNDEIVEHFKALTQSRRNIINKAFDNSTLND